MEAAIESRLVAPANGSLKLPGLEAELEAGAEEEAEKQRQKAKQLFVSEV